MNWLLRKIDTFETWIANKLSGWKTKAIATLAFLGNAAAVLQEFITGLPITTLIDPIHLLIINSVLFGLVYWARRLTDKTEE